LATVGAEGAPDQKEVLFRKNVRRDEGHMMHIPTFTITYLRLRLRPSEAFCPARPTRYLLSCEAAVDRGLSFLGLGDRLAEDSTTGSIQFFGIGPEVSGDTFTFQVIALPLFFVKIVVLF
jgi:hypothetical protein